MFTLIKLIYIVIYILFATTARRICILNCLRYLIYKLFNTIIGLICILHLFLLPLKQSYLVSLILSFPAVPTNTIHTTPFKTIIAVKYSIHLSTVTSLSTAMWITHFYILNLCLKCGQFIWKCFYCLWRT